MDFISLDGSDKEKVRLGMAVCHSLSTTSSGEILGNQIDQVSFEAAGAVLDHKIGEGTRVDFDKKRYTILKDFAFDNHRATQSVIVEDEAGSKQIFVKGSPEAIEALCLESTVPKTFKETVQASAKTGVYQLAMACKEYELNGKVSEVRRDDVETKLTFVGFVNFQNVMKEDTPAVIKELEEGNVGVAMITGDSVLTGICIAKEAGMIKPNRAVLMARKSDIDTIEWVDAETDEVGRPPSDTMLTDPDSNIDLAVS
jgi:cation-transporting ATPase 13A1